MVDLAICRKVVGIVCLGFFFNDTATTEIYTLSLHDALPIFLKSRGPRRILTRVERSPLGSTRDELGCARRVSMPLQAGLDRKSTRLNSSHANISYAVFCLKKKNSLLLLRQTHRYIPPLNSLH